MLGLLLLSNAIGAEDRRPTRGERLALDGRCAAALPELERELERSPGDAHVALRLGQCALRLKDYPRAVASLEAALAADPTLAEGRLDLARARYHAGDLDGADAALEASRHRSHEALWQLYRGMTDLRRGDAHAAVAALERAVEINATGWNTAENPEPVEPVASYYLGLALEAAGQQDRARSTLRGVADSWAGTEWADEAGAALEESQTSRAWLTLGGGMEYDDNVVLAGRDTPLPENISDEGGFRGVWHARGGFDLGRWNDTTAGVLGSYQGRAHVDSDLDDLDSHFPTASLWVDQALSEQTHLRAFYDLGFAVVDDDPFLFSNSGKASLIHAWSKRQTSALRGTLFADDYRTHSDDVPDVTGGGTCPPSAGFCGPAGLDERRARNRDGWGASVGVAHAVSPDLGLAPLRDPALHGGYTFTNFEAEGREYSRQAHRVNVGVSFFLPYNVALDVDASYENRVYDHPSTFPDPGDVQPGAPYTLSDTRRREHVTSASARLAMPLTARVSASAHYRYLDSHSTSDVFDYDQHVVGLLFNVTFARQR